MSPTKLQQIKEATAADETLHTLKNTVLVGWPIERSSVPLNIIQYWNYRDEITAIDGLLYKGQRLMVPVSLQTEMLNKLHEAHMGIVKTQTRAREILFWPKMNQDIENFIGQCAVCHKFRNSNCKEPLRPQEIPSRPWAKVAADMFQFKGSEYLLCVDYYSKYPEIVRMPTTSSSQTIIAFKSVFARHGIRAYQANSLRTMDHSSQAMRSRNLRLSGTLFTPLPAPDTRSLTDRQKGAFRLLRTC